MARQVVWSAVAENDRKRILVYWVEWNGSPAYSLKLFRRINGVLERLQRVPYMGRPTDVHGMRVMPVDRYLMFYEVMADAIVVHHLCHEKRDRSSIPNVRR